MTNLINPNAGILKRDLRDRRCDMFLGGDSFLDSGNALNRPGTCLMKIAGAADGRYKVRRWTTTPDTSSSPMTKAAVAASPDWQPVDNLGVVRNAAALYAVDSVNRWSLPCALAQFQSNTGANWHVNGQIVDFIITPASFMGKSPQPLFGTSGKAIARLLYFGHPSGEIWNRTTRVHTTSASGANALRTDIDFTADSLGLFQDGADGARAASGAYRESRLNALDTDLTITKSGDSFAVLLFDHAAYTGGLTGTPHGLSDDRRLAVNITWQDADASGNPIPGNGVHVLGESSWGAKGFAEDAASSGSTTDLKRYPTQQLADFVDLCIPDLDGVAWFIHCYDFAEEWVQYLTLGESAYLARINAIIAKDAAAAALVGIDHGVCFWWPYYHHDSTGNPIGGGTEAQGRENFRTLAALYASVCTGRVCMVNAAEYAGLALFNGSPEGNAKLVELGYDAWNIGGTYGGGDGIIDATAWNPADASGPGDMLDPPDQHPSGNPQSDKDEQVAGLVLADLFRRTLQSAVIPGEGGGASSTARTLLTIGAM